MELLIAILTWLGLITGGNTYSNADIQRIAAQNQSAVNAHTQTLNALDKAPPADGDWEMPYR